MRAALFALCIALTPAIASSGETPVVLIDMPDGIPIPGLAPCQPVMLTIDRAGTSWIDDRAVPRPELGKILVRLIEARPEHCRRVFIRAHDDTPYGDIVSVLSLIRREGIDRIGLIDPG